MDIFRYRLQCIITADSVFGIQAFVENFANISMGGGVIIPVGVLHISVGPKPSIAEADNDLLQQVVVESDCIEPGDITGGVRGR